MHSTGRYIMILSPEMIILGGGVMHQEQLFPMIYYVRYYCDISKQNR